MNMMVFTIIILAAWSARCAAVYRLMLGEMHLETCGRNPFFLRMFGIWLHGFISVLAVAAAAVVRM